MKKGFSIEEEIKNNPNAIVYDPYKDECDVSDLPDVPKLLDQVIEILEYMSIDKIKNMKKNNNDDYTKHMEEKFNTFADRYYSLFQKIISGDDITPLLSMMSAIHKIKSGKLTVEKAEEYLGEELTNKFIVPNLTNEQKKQLFESMKNNK